MSEKGRKIVARIALAFMILFVASLTAWCFDRTLFHGAIGYCAIFTGFFGIALFVVLHFTQPPQEKDRADRPEGTDGAGTADDGQTTNTAPPRAGDGADTDTDTPR